LGVIHRDIKPANLLVDRRGHLWVTDLGLAQVQSDPRLTLTGDLVGTLRYMSPEQALAKRVAIDYRTDVYSLGATLYELLTLEPAFIGTDRQELLRLIAFEEPRPPRRLNRAIPKELETIVLKAMAKAPQDRYATAQELADDLERFVRDEPVKARRLTPWQRAGSAMGATAAGGGGTLAVVGAGHRCFDLLRGTGEPPGARRRGQHRHRPRSGGHRSPEGDGSSRGEGESRQSSRTD
jgi:serine/threonine protein kinase